MGLSSKEGSGSAWNREGERRVPRGPAAPILTGALLCLPLLPSGSPGQGPGGSDFSFPTVSHRFGAGRG